jgi:hypothetical protein
LVTGGSRLPDPDVAAADDWRFPIVQVAAGRILPKRLSTRHFSPDDDANGDVDT